MSMTETTLEINLESLDSLALKELLARTNAARLSLNQLVTKISQHTGGLAELDAQLQSSEQRFSQQQRQVQELTGRLDQARLAARMTQGSAAESSATQQVIRLETELASETEKLERQKQEHMHAVTTIRKQQEAEQHARDQANTELAALRQTRTDVQQEYRRIHAALGNALYAEFEAKLKGLRDQEQAIEKMLKDTRAPIQHLQLHIGEVLKEWPALAEKAQREAGLPQHPPTETECILKAFLAYLATLSDLAEKHAKYNGGAGAPDEYEMVRLLTLSEHDMRLVLGVFISQGVDRGSIFVSQRIRDVEERLQEHEEAQQRAWEKLQRR